MPRACLTCGRAPHPSCRRPPRASTQRSPPGAGAWGRGGPCNSPPRSSSCPRTGSGSRAARLPPAPPLPSHPRRSSGPARREGGDCGEGGAPPASRGLERAWPRGRQRRAGTHCAARPGSAGSARRAGGAEDAGGLPRLRPALLPPRAPGAPLAALPPPPPRPLRGQREGAGPASRSPRGWRPRIFQSPPPPPPLFSSGRAPVDAEGQPRAFPGLTAGGSRPGRGTGDRGASGAARLRGEKPPGAPSPPVSSRCTRDPASQPARGLARATRLSIPAQMVSAPWALESRSAFLPEVAPGLRESR
ncbi:proline-rich protein 2-like [Moschus berezovskii]|uniref:proline-rich protein 2-like n=1 Tax=Moschus berezovskii TaxID=68408 RepID=UPI002444CB1D|nr:proline-rich protein 2-like [Moschus berezovskii]